MGRVTAFVLHPERAHAKLRREQVGPGEPGPARIGAPRGGNVGWHGQQARVAPDAGGPGLDAGARQRGQFVAHLQRAETLRAGMIRAEFEGGAALAAEEVTGETEAGWGAR